MTLRYRRAGEPAAPTPIRAHRAIDISPYVPVEPSRGNCIRGLTAIIDATRQTPESWREVWADEWRELERARERKRIDGLTAHELHCQQRHPDYEYASTENARKSGESPKPQGEGWEENDIVECHQYKDGDVVEERWRNWTRGPYTEINYWRRRKNVKTEAPCRA